MNKSIIHTFIMIIKISIFPIKTRKIEEYYNIIWK